MREYKFFSPEARTLLYNLIHQILQIFLCEHFILYSGYVRLHVLHFRLYVLDCRLHFLDFLFKCGSSLCGFGSQIVRRLPN